MTKYGEATCVVCGRTFLKKHPAHKYCHWQCQGAAAKARRADYARTPDEVLGSRIDEVDLLEWKKQQAQPQAEYEVEPIQRQLKIPRGRYVYAWFNDQSDLPFYIGKGVDDRAWRRHIHRDSGISQLCQQIRSCSSGFRVEIIRDNMTNEGAMLVESALIAFVSQCGGFLSNQVDPLCRQERPPLELCASGVGS